MKLMILLAIQIGFFAGNSFAAMKNYTSLANDYYQYERALKQNLDPCAPRTSCFKVACDLLGSFECDEVSEQENIRRACQGVWGGECVNTAITFLGKFEYDDNEEMVQLVQSCRGVYDLECVRYSCQKLGRFGCDDLEEVTRVNATCASRYPYFN